MPGSAQNGDMDVRAFWFAGLMLLLGIRSKPIVTYSTARSFELSI